jgi:hypothetical protein
MGNEDVKHILLSCPETETAENAIYEQEMAMYK